MEMYFLKINFRCKNVSFFQVTFFWTLKRVLKLLVFKFENLTSETVEGPALSLKSIDYVHGSYSFPLGMLGVSDSITDDILKEYLEDTTGLFVDQTRDTFYTTTSCKTTNGGFCDTLDVITKNLTVTLSASLSKSLSSFTTSSHDEILSNSDSKPPVQNLFMPAWQTIQ